MDRSGGDADRSWEDTDAAWGDRPEHPDDVERFERERPPHHGG